MDADSSYGGSDTAQENGNNSSIESTHISVTEIKPNNDQQKFYHKNEITLPVNQSDETDFRSHPGLPHYKSTANLNISDELEAQETGIKSFASTTRLNETPKPSKRTISGLDNPAFDEEEDKPEQNGAVKSSFGDNKPTSNGEVNGLQLTSPTKSEESSPEAVNLELINLKPNGNDVAGPYENGKNGLSSIPVKKDRDNERTNPYDEYFVPVHEHKKYMR